MSDQYTSISLPSGPGLSEHGRKSRQEMLVAFRRAALRQKQEALRILRAKDSEFIVEQHTGVHVRRNVIVLPPYEIKPKPQGTKENEDG